MIKELEKLQSGTDIRGIDINIELIKALANGFSSFIENKYTIKKLRFAIGMDSRITGPNLKDAFIDILNKKGYEIYDCGLSTTPAMFMTTIFEDYDCHGAIMVTASHLPSEYNGLKFFTKDGGCEKEDLISIIQLSQDAIVNKQGMVEHRNLIDDYSNYLVDFIRNEINSNKNYEKPLIGLNIIVDAGNGSGGFFADKVLNKLGAETKGSQFLKPDGNFPNHIPNPENKKAMKSIRTAVLKYNADLGIIFDTDVDRAAIVSKEGYEINKNSLIALASAITLEENPNTVIVTDSITSTGLESFISDLGGVHHRFKRGYKNVINESKRLNKEGIRSYLAIETSGHAAFWENDFLDDGAYLIAKILIKLAKLKQEHKDITELIKSLNHPIRSIEKRIKINDDDFRSYGQNIVTEIEKYAKNIDGWKLPINNYEGVKIMCGNNDEDGWFLLRLSLHEPVLVLNVESYIEGGVENIMSKIDLFFNKYDKLNM